MRRFVQHLNCINMKLHWQPSIINTAKLLRPFELNVSFLIKCRLCMRVRGVGVSAGVLGETLWCATVHRVWHSFRFLFPFCLLCVIPQMHTFNIKSHHCLHLPCVSTHKHTHQEQCPCEAELCFPSLLTVADPAVDSTSTDSLSFVQRTICAL